MIHNFNAGPSILPKEVFEEASRAILNFNGTGLSILEIGHRTPLFEAVLDEAVSLVKELMNLNDDKEVLFLHGGASTQFFQIPMNFLGAKEKAAYLDCGTWGSKAIKEAKNFGSVDIVGTSKEKGYTFIPKDYAVPSDAKYFHLTTNNTIEGTEMFSIPRLSVPLIADMSSDILSQQMDFNQFALIYAGAQKNIGAAGVNLVVLDKKLKQVTDRKIPSMLDYQQHIANGSMLNTPPVFAIYVCMLTLRWLKSIGGISAIEKINIQKAQMVYDVLDANPVFRPTVAKEDRSRMNVVFVIDDPEKEKAFQQICKEQQFIGVKGHRSVGGFRLSLYNALPIESVHAFCEIASSFK